jgi:hypothetical protein
MSSVKLGSLVYTAASSLQGLYSTCEGTPGPLNKHLSSKGTTLTCLLSNLALHLHPNIAALAGTAPAPAAA